MAVRLSLHSRLAVAVGRRCGVYSEGGVERDTGPSTLPRLRSVTTAQGPPFDSAQGPAFGVLVPKVILEAGHWEAGRFGSKRV